MEEAADGPKLLQSNLLPFVRYRPETATLPQTLQPCVFVRSQRSPKSDVCGISFHRQVRWKSFEISSFPSREQTPEGVVSKRLTTEANARKRPWNRTALLPITSIPCKVLHSGCLRLRTLWTVLSLLPVLPSLHPRQLPVEVERAG